MMALLLRWLAVVGTFLLLWHDVTVVIATATVTSEEDGSIPSTTTTVNKNNNNNDDDDGNDSTMSTSTSTTECGLWVAPSSLPNTGLGMYAGKDFQRGDYFQSPMGEITVPIIDMKLHNNNNPDFSYLWDSYSWSTSPTFPMHFEGYEHETSFASPGFGSVANSFLPLQNVHHLHPQYINHGLHRSQDPGAGAVSEYGNRNWEATRDIRAGEELFVSYGEFWFEHRTEYLGPVPLFDDLNTATDLFKSFLELHNNNNTDGPPIEMHILHELWREFLHDNQVYKDSRVFAAFNHSNAEEELQQLVQGKTLTEIRQQESTRDNEWLQQNGVCGDHIQVGPSTIPQAGLGAFASRDLPQGTIVSALPMVHIPDRSIFNMYEIIPDPDNDGEFISNPSSGIKGVQLITNYCFGHRESTLLLCPYGPQAPYINHNQTQANVKLVWSDPKRGNHQPQYLQSPVEALAEIKWAILGMDVIALRPIQQGEEIFLDYGDEWEAAWQGHIKAWRPIPGADTYHNSETLFVDDESTESIEWLEHPLPNLQVKCSDAFVSDAWKEYYPDHMDEYMHDTEGEEHPCSVQGSRVDEHGNHLFTAVLFHDDDVEDDEDRTVLEDVPKEAIVYHNRPYTTDMFLPNAFRHDIRIPDELFPVAWKNLASSYSSSPSTLSMDVPKGNLAQEVVLGARDGSMVQ